MAILDRFKSKWSKNEKSVVKKTEQSSLSKNVESASTKTEKSSSVGVKQVTSFDASQTRVLLQPWVTEKSAALASHGTYVFVVEPYTSAQSVSAAVKEKYGVRPARVRMQNMKGKVVRFGGRFGRQKAMRKALVTMPKGTTLSVFEGV